MIHTTGAHQLTIRQLHGDPVAVDFHHVDADHHVTDTQDQPLTHGWLQVGADLQAHGVTVERGNQDREGR